MWTEKREDEEKGKEQPCGRVRGRRGKETRIREGEKENHGREREKNNQ